MATRKKPHEMTREERIKELNSSEFGEKLIRFVREAVAKDIEGHLAAGHDVPVVRNGKTVILKGYRTKPAIPAK